MLKRWAGSDGVSDTDRAAAAKVLDLVAARAASSDSQQSGVPSADNRQRGSSGSSSGSGLSPAKLSSEVAERCEGTAGDWCGQYLMQEPIPAKVRGCHHVPCSDASNFHFPPCQDTNRWLHTWTACKSEMRESSLH